MDIERIRRAMGSLEADGIIEPTGEFKRDPKTGSLRPLYRLTEKGLSKEVADAMLLAAAKQKGLPS